MRPTTVAVVDLATLDTLRARLQIEWEDLGVDRSRVQRLGDLVAVLPRVFAGPDLARDWLHVARPEDLGGATPLELIRDGRIDRVLLLLRQLAGDG